MQSLDWHRVEQRLLDDTEFLHASRRWTTRLRLDFGDHSRRLTFRNGALSGIAPTSKGDGSELFVSAPVSEWRRLLTRVPRPFYQELYFAQLHHGFEMNPEPRDYAAYYPALQRLVQILREENADG